MSDLEMNTLAELTQEIESAWADLHAFLARLDVGRLSARDANGWTVRDHITHIAVWEDSVAVLFRGGKRHEALGLSESFYADASFDEMNEVIKKAKEKLTLREAIALLDEVHSGLMDYVRRLTDAELATTVRYFFRTSPQSDKRRVIDFIYANTGDHYREHLPWMKAIVGAE